MSKFNKELRKSIGMGLVAAFGFLIAFVWRDLIVEYVNTFAEISPIQGRLYTAIVITIISVLGILIVSKITKVKR